MKKSKYPVSLSFYTDLNKFNSLKLQKESTKEEKATVHDNASELYNDYLGIYFDEYNALPNALDNKYNLVNLFFEIYNYDVWLKNRLIQQGKVIKKNLHIFLTC